MVNAVQIEVVGGEQLRAGAGQNVGHGLF
jgi:hypothetical protein